MTWAKIALSEVNVSAQQKYSIFNIPLRNSQTLEDLYHTLTTREYIKAKILECLGVI